MGLVLIYFVFESAYDVLEVLGNQHGFVVRLLIDVNDARLAVRPGLSVVEAQHVVAG